MIASFTPPEPVFDYYCNWLVEIGGKVDRGENRWGGYSVLHSPDDTLCVVIPDTMLERMFVSSMIEYLDYRLGLHSPWNKMPATQKDAAED